MTITSAFVLFAVIWFLTFLIVIPFKIKTQGDLGMVAKGTQAGAPEVHNLKKKAIITTGVTIVIWFLLIHHWKLLCNEMKKDQELYQQKLLKIVGETFKVI